MLQTSVVQTHLTFQKNREKLKGYGPCLLDDILYKGVLLFTLRERWIFFCLLNNQKYRRKYRILSFKQPEVKMKVLVIQACLTLCVPQGLQPLSVEFSRQEWNRQPFPSPGIFLTQGLNPGLLHCRQIIYLPSEPSGTFQTLAVGIFYSNKML